MADGDMLRSHALLESEKIAARLDVPARVPRVSETNGNGGEVINASADMALAYRNDNILTAEDAGIVLTEEEKLIHMKRSHRAKQRRNQLDNTSEGMFDAPGNPRLLKPRKNSTLDMSIDQSTGKASVYVLSKAGKPADEGVDLTSPFSTNRENKARSRTLMDYLRKGKGDKLKPALVLPQKSGKSLHLLMQEAADSPTEPSDHDAIDHMKNLGEMAFHVKKDNLKSFLESIIKHHIDLLSVTAANECGSTPLHIAAMHNSEAIAMHLVTEIGVNVNAPDNWMRTPLDEAVRCGHEKLAAILHAAGGKNSVGFLSYDQKRRMSNGGHDSDHRFNRSGSFADMGSLMGSFHMNLQKSSNVNNKSNLNGSFNGSVEHETGSSVNSPRSVHSPVHKYIVGNESVNNPNYNNGGMKVSLEHGSSQGRLDSAANSKRGPRNSTSLSYFPPASPVTYMPSADGQRSYVVIDEEPGSTEWEMRANDIQVEGVIGEGAFGEIKRGRWRGANVAIKTLKVDCMKDAMALKEFHAEMSVWSRLAHPCIVQFLGVCYMPSMPPIMLCELMEESLQSKMQELKQWGRNMDHTQALKVSQQIAAAMQYLHSRRPYAVIHRDLKPANILLAQSGDAKVADFGLSKMFDLKAKVAMMKQQARDDAKRDDRHSSEVQYEEDDDVLYSQTFLMTGETGAYKYMAPEVFRHEMYGLKADVYSFSMIVFECFEGIIVAEDPVAWAMKAASSAGRPPFAFLYALENRRSQMTMDLIEQCWQSNFKERPSFPQIVKILRKIEKVPKEQRSLKNVTDGEEEKGNDCACNIM